MDVTADSLGADVFVQRGSISCMAGHHRVAFMVPVPPKAILSSSAKSMIDALELSLPLAFLHKITRGTFLRPPPAGMRLVRPLAFIITAVTDGASANLLAVNHLTWLLDAMSGRSEVVIYFMSHSLYAAHTLSLCARSHYAYLGGSTAASRLFLSGLLSAAHGFSKSSYVVKLFGASVRVVMGTWVLRPTEAHRLGVCARDGATTLAYTVLLRFLCENMLQKVELGDSMLEAINTVSAILNTDWVHHADADAAAGDRWVHVCGDGCRCVEDLQSV